jgi:hypothetical protein
MLDCMPYVKRSSLLQTIISRECQMNYMIRKTVLLAVNYRTSVYVQVMSTISNRSRRNSYCLHRLASKFGFREGVLAILGAYTVIQVNYTRATVAIFPVPHRTHNSIKHLPSVPKHNRRCITREAQDCRDRKIKAPTFKAIVVYSFNKLESASFFLLMR